MMSRRRGFSLVEMIVVMVVGAIALAAVYRTLVVQQRTYRQEGARIATQQAARTTVNVLAAELREISTTGNDLQMIAPESLTVRLPRKLGIVCSVDAGSDKVTVWLLSETNPFRKDDWVIGFADGDVTRSNDDAWVRDQIVSTPSSGTCPTDWPPYEPMTLSFAIDGLADAAVVTGAQVRSSVPYTYGIRNINDEWVLARHADGETEWQVLVGPLASPENGGLEFTYIDASSGDVTPAPGMISTDPATLSSIQRIRISAAARSRGRVDPDDTYYLDSLSLELYLQNN